MKKVLVITTAVLLVGCSSINKKMPWYSDEPKPKPLAELKNQVNFNEMKRISGFSKSANYDAVKMSPTIKGDVALLSGPKGEIQLYDIPKQSVLWSMKVAQGLETSPEVSKDIRRVAIIDKNDHLQVFDVQRNTLLMNVELSEESFAKPIIHGDDVIVKTISGELSVYSMTSGERRWHYVPELDDVMVRASSSVYVRGDRVYAGFSDGRMVAFNLKHGNVIWEQTLTDIVSTQDVEERYDIVADPVGDARHLYVVSFDGQVAALDYNTGRKDWSQSINTYKNIAQDEQYIFVVTRNDTVYALRKDSGRIAWKLEDYKYRKLSSPVIADNKLLLFDAEGYVHCLAPDTGQALARIKTDKAVVNAEMAANKRVAMVPLVNGSVSELQIG